MGPNIFVSVVSYDSKSFRIGGKRRFIFSGEIHYFRVPRGLWYDRLLKAKRAHLNTVASYIAWNWHEEEEGVYRFDGDKDIETYINLCRDLGLFFIARPGPYICSEWDSSGHPNWLYAKTNVFRTVKEPYLSYALRWYDVILPIVKRTLCSKGGATVMFQIENEYFWGNVPLHFALYEKAREYLGDDVPIVTNENRYVHSTPIIDTIDSYPDPWVLNEFERKIEEVKKSQRDKPLMFMELEGGWFSIFGKPLPTERGSFPAGWTEMLVKTAMARGVKAINFYMFHGGTNPEYFTAKYITTTYDYDAAISEWGELKPRYYAIRRLGLFIESFEDLLTEAEESEIEVLEGEADVFCRKIGDTSLVFIRNIQDKSICVKIKVSDVEVPRIPVPPKYMKIVLVNYVFPETLFKLKYSTFEPLLVTRVGNRVVAVFYGDENEENETVLESKTPIKVKSVSSKEVNVTVADKVIVIKHVQGRKDYLVELTSEDKTLLLVFTTKERAGKTWIFENSLGKFIAISDIYFMREADGNKVVFEDYIDSKRTATVISPVKLPGFNEILEKVYNVEIEFSAEKLPSLKLTPLNEAFYEDKPSLNTMTEIKPYTPLEKAGFYRNGFYEYIILFKLREKPVNNTLYFSLVNDYAVVFLNNNRIGSGYRCFEVEAKDLKKENELYVILEATGHNNDGMLPILNGLLNGIYLGKISEKEISSWSYYEIPSLKEVYEKGIVSRIDYSLLLNNPLATEEFNKLIELKKPPKEVKEFTGSGVYEHVFELNEEDLRHSYILELHEGRGAILVFVNRKHAGSWLSWDRGRKYSFDISDYLKKGLNKLELIVIDSKGVGRLLLKTYQLKVEGTWRVIEGTQGIREKWFEEKPSNALKTIEKCFWKYWRLQVNVPQKILAPLKITIDSNCRCLIYFNSKLIGRYVPEGPQRDFYVPEPLVREENKIAVMCIPVGEEPKVEIKAGFYTTTVLKEIKIFP